MIERIALHQTRLHTPGLSLDASGIALGTRGLVLLPSIDRLAAFLAIYSRDRSFDELLPSLAIQVVRSGIGGREITFEVAAESSDRMDRLADTARLVGGFTFTGTSRHFVQYRDAAGPFGYDATELATTSAPLALYHERSAQTYDVERVLVLRDVLLRLMPRPDRSTLAADGARVLVAEEGLGPALVQYLFRSEVAGDACLAEWPPEGALDDAPVRRWIVRVPDLPPRMRGLLASTPGITAYLPASQGVAVEVGFRHPVELRACPVFDPAGLVFLRGRGEDPLRVGRLPTAAALRDLARVEWRDAAPPELASARTQAPDAVRVPVRLVPSSRPWQRVTAAWIPTPQLPLLRRLAYSIPRATITTTVVALTRRGVIVRSREGVDGIPLGSFFSELQPRLYVPAGHALTPLVTPEVLAGAIGASPSQHVFVAADEHVFAVEDSAFSPLEAMLLRAPAWEALAGRAVDKALDDAPVDLAVTSIGLLPVLHVRPPER